MRRSATTYILGRKKLESSSETTGKLPRAWPLMSWRTGNETSVYRASGTGKRTLRIFPQSTVSISYGQARVL